MQRAVKTLLLFFCLVAPGAATADPIEDAIMTVVTPFRETMKSILPPSNSAAPAPAPASAPCAKGASGERCRNN